MIELFSLLVALFAYLGPVEIEYVDTSAIQMEWRGRDIEAYAHTTECVDGQAGIVMGSDTQETWKLVHELLHVADCRDNGLYDGSLEPGGCNTVPTDCAHSWVYFALWNREAATRLLARPAS